MEHKSINASRRETYWQGHVEQWLESQMTQTKYCQDHGLNLYQLAYWKKKFGNSTSGELLGKLRLVPIVPTSSPSPVAGSESNPGPEARVTGSTAAASSGLEVVSNGVAVRLDRGFDPEALRKVLQVTRSL